MNPTVHFIELTNDNATKETKLIEFFQNSRLTYYKEGWVQI